MWLGRLLDDIWLWDYIVQGILTLIILAAVFIIGSIRGKKHD